MTISCQTMRPAPIFKWLRSTVRCFEMDLHILWRVPDFRVAHEAVAETDRETMGVESTVTVVLGNRVHVRSVSGIDGVALHALLWGNTPPIVNAACGGETRAIPGLTRCLRT